MVIQYIIISCILVFFLIQLRLLHISNFLLSLLLFFPFTGHVFSFSPAVSMAKIMLVPFLVVGLLNMMKFIAGLKLNFLFLSMWFIFASVTVAKGIFTTSGSGTNFIGLNILDYGYFVLAMSLFAVKDNIRIESITLPILIGGLYLSAVGVIQLYFPSVAFTIGIDNPMHFVSEGSYKLFANESRIIGLHNNPNAVSIYYVISSICFLYYIFSAQNFLKKILSTAGLSLTLFCLIHTASRAAYLSFVISGIILLFIAVEQKSKFYYYSKILLGFPVAIALIVLIFNLREFGGESDSGRLLLWGTVFTEALSSPLVFLFGTFQSVPLNAHNGYIQIFHNYGIIGLGCFSYILINSLYVALRKAKKIKPHGLVMCLIISFALIDLSHSSSVRSVIFWAFLALAHAPSLVLRDEIDALRNSPHPEKIPLGN